MKKKPEDAPGISLGDRLVAAVLTALFAAITLIAYFFLSHKLWDVYRPGIAMYRNFLFSETSLYVIGVSALLGFILGAERISHVFGFFWGTNGDLNK
ncbi:hypothetical protein BH11PSE11_BH11PSE11_14250 [soil metagenome]